MQAYKLGQGLGFYGIISLNPDPYQKLDWIRIRIRIKRKSNKIGQLLPLNQHLILNLKFKMFEWPNFEFELMRKVYIIMVNSYLSFCDIF